MEVRGFPLCLHLLEGVEDDPLLVSLQGRRDQLVLEVGDVRDLGAALQDVLELRQELVGGDHMRDLSKKDKGVNIVPLIQKKLI